MRRSVRRLVAAVAGAGLVLGPGAGAVRAAPVSAASTVAIDSAVVDSPTASLSARMAAQLRLVPGGKQISANEVSWQGGRAVMVLPLDGRSQAPRSSAAAVPDVTAADIEGCPTQIIGNDYYCFYADNNWGQRRLQFKDVPQGVDLDTYTFRNKTSSWVNGSGRAYIYVYNNGRLIWAEYPNTKTRYVGDAANDRADTFQADLGT